MDINCYYLLFSRLYYVMWETDNGFDFFRINITLRGEDSIMT